MMTREHHRRRSPDSRRRRKERRDSREQLQSQQIPVPIPRYEEQFEPIETRSRALSSISSSSSTSSSLLNISRPSNRFGFTSFFTGHTRKQRRVKRRRSGLFRGRNSSSSSVNSDLAYGRGYIRRRKSREFSPPNSPGRHPGRPSVKQRAQTDEEILELGRQFAEIARQQNAEDLRAAGRTRPSTLVGAAAALSSFRRTNSGNSVRGVGSSKPRRDSSPDDSEWESASDDESSSGEFDSGLAYGSTSNLPPAPSKAIQAIQPLSPITSPRSLQAPIHSPQLRRKRSLVDPNLFGPVNSLRGYVEEPCGFERVDRTSLSEPRPSRPYEPSIPPSETLSEGRPLQRVFPVPTSDPSRFDATRGSVVSSQQDLATPARPAPVPIQPTLQQPRPIAPVSRKVLDSVETDSRYSDRSSSKKALGEAAIAGIAGAAVGAALSSDRKDDRDRHEGRRDREGKRRSKRSEADFQEDKSEKRKSREAREVREVRDERPEKRRERRSELDRDLERERHYREMVVPEVARESEKERHRLDKYHNDAHDNDQVRDKGEYDRKEERKIDRAEDRREERREQRREERREERREVERARRSDSEGYKRLDGPKYASQKGPIDPFQFQVADDAFPTPLHTTPKRPLTPNVITVDREPDFSRFEASGDDSRPLERLSRKDSYERELRDAQKVYEATEHATAPVSGAAFAAAAAAVIAEDRRGRSRSRGSDASSRNRSRRGDSPKREKDAVQEDADRYYREAELARRIREEEKRSRTSSESSVVEKWKQTQQPVVDLTSPPEMEHEKEKKKSPYDGPDADVRIDNVLEHPSELSRFQTSSTRGLSSIPVFIARDPSAERERPMLNLVRPTPIHTPVPEKQKATEESRSEPAKKVDDVSVSKSAPDVAPVPTPKAVSWGENQTKHYVVESPEIEDDPYSGTKVVTPAKTPRSRSGKKSGWGFIASALSGAGDEAASSTASTAARDIEGPKPRHTLRDGEKSTTRRSSISFESPDDSPPIPGPKPPSPRSSQMPGAFAEDPAFTANIAAALEGSGFDPNIVIDNANFHRRDSPPGSNDSGVYQSPFVESVTDLGITNAPRSAASVISREPGFVMGEVPETPDEKDSSTRNSQILSMLKEQREQDDAKKPEATTDDTKAAESPRSVAEDDWSKLSKKERKRREKAAKAQTLVDDKAIDNTSRKEQDLEAEFIGAPADEDEDSSLKKKKSKKSKKAVVVQDESREPTLAESTQVVVPVDAFRDVQDAKTVQSEDAWDLPKESRRRSKPELDALTTSSTSTRATEFRSDISRKSIDTDFTTPDDEWEMSRKDSYRSRRSSDGYSPSRPVLASDLSRESSYRVIDSDSIPATEEEWDTPRKSKKSSRRSRDFDSPPRSAAASEASLEFVRRTTDSDIASLPDTPKRSRKTRRATIDDEFAAPISAAQSVEDLGTTEKSKKSKRDSGAYDSPSRVEPPAEDIVESPKEMSESFSEFRRDRSGTLEEGFDTPKKSKKSKRSSIGYEDLPSTPRSAAPSEVSVGSSRKSKQDVYADSPTRSAPPSEIGTDDSRKKSKKKKRRSTASELPEDGKSAEESEPPDRGKGRFEAQDRDVSSVVSVPIHFEEHRSSRSRVRADTLDDTKSVTSAPGGSDRKISRSDKDKRGSGTSSFFDRFRSSIGMVEDARKSEGDKKSFLDNAGTLGAGVGSTGAAVTPASQESRSNATNAPLEEESQTVPFTPERQSTSREVDFIDPEIVPREIRPAIDPKYGDLLPLPPSLPGSPVAELGEDFPPLPDSRPESPEHERHIREVPTHNRRRSTQDTPTRPKTPSQSAIPIQFRLGHKRTPSRSSPSVSPTTGGSEFGSESRRRASSRPTSWEGSREFKPLLLLLKNSRNSVDASSSPERDYSPGEKFASPSSSETREDSAYALSRLSGRSPDCDSPLRDAAVATPVASTPRELSEASDLKRASDVVSLPRHEYPFGQLSDEHPHQRSHKADEFHLEPLPEQPALESAEDVELPPQKPEPIELLNPATEIPSSDFYTPLVEARDPIDANISQISLPLVPALKSTEPADIAEEAPKDKQDDIAPLPEIVTPAADEPEAATVLDDHTLRQGDLAKHLETHDKDSSLLDVIPESKTPNSVDSFGTARSVADDIGSAQLSRFLEELGDYSHTRKAMSDDGDEFLEASSNIGTPLVQEEAPKFEQALPIQEEAPVQEEDRAIQDEAPLVQDDDLYTQQAVPFSDIGRELTSEPAPIAEQVERSVLEEVSTKDTPQTSEQATLDTKPEEAPAPPKSRILSALAALRSGWGSKETPKDTPKETIVTRQPEPEPEPEPELEPATAPEPEPEPQLEPELKPEPEPESLDVQQDTGSTSKKGKKKKKKKSKSQTTELSLEDAPSVSNTQNVGLGETSTQIIVDDAPADSTSASIEGVRSIEEKPILVEEPATIEVEPVPTEEMTSITERDISTTKPELVTPALESTAIEAEPHAVEMSPPETSTVEQESTSVEPELTSVELETPATEPGVAAPIPKIPSSEPEPTIAEAAISTTEADLESAIIKPELTATENEPSTVKPEPSAQLGDSTVEPEVSTELERVDTELGGPASEKSAILPSEIPSTEPESTPTEPRDLAVEATEAEPVVTEPQPVITEPEPAAENEPSVVETETTAQHEIPPPEPEVVPADQARGEVESEAIVPESEPLSTPVLETDDIRPEPTPVNPVVEAIENELAAIEPAATEVEVQETPAILPEVTAVEREVPIVEAGVEHVEKEPIVPGSDVPAELASSIEEPAGPVDEVKQEVVEENPEPPVVEPQTFHQDQPEVIASEEPRDVEPSISEETPQPTKKSKKKKKGKKTQVAEPEPETEAAGGQIPEDDSALQAETQNCPTMR
ncbi:hypothetical protein F5Y04DRAFT_250084 [Hypomontagnella monticulosa]|nr:hypothetical protein F5Y04DRAFT_250084 [Hypomontagnella monticulosa]